MSSPSILGTAQIPQQFWKDARLVGSVPFIASAYDQRASYCMYVPESRYQSEGQKKLLLVVTVHGSLRRAEHCRDSLIDFADQVGACILAPLFPAGIDDPNDSHNYKFLRYKDIRYDLILLSMIEDVSKRWPGIETSKFSLIGFSGGGQFVSRFFLLHPDRLDAVSIGAPGTITSLDDTLEWPKGLNGVEKQFDGLSIDLVALKSVKYVQLVVGDQDTDNPGGGLLKWFAKVQGTPELDLPDRIQALEKLKAQLVSNEVKLQYDLVPGVGHENAKILPVVIEFLSKAVCHSHPSNCF